MALPGDTTADGVPIFYSGGKLAADLSLPRLRTRWEPEASLAGAQRAAHRLMPTPAQVYEQAAQITADAARRIADPGTSAGERTAIAYAAADLLTATAHAWEGANGGPLTQAAELLDRAAHETIRPTPARPSTPGYPLRDLVRMITATASSQADRNTAVLMRLLAALAGIGDAIADLRSTQQRLHQADAARACVAGLRTYQPPATTPSTSPLQPGLGRRWWPDLDRPPSTERRRGR